MKLVYSLLFLNAVACGLLLLAEVFNFNMDLAVRSTVVEQQAAIAKLQERAQKTEALLNKMAKGLGYDGPDYWH